MERMKRWFFWLVYDIDGDPAEFILTSIVVVGCILGLILLKLR